MFNSLQLDVVSFCAEEVRRQRDTQLAVFWMVNAWDWAHRTCRTETLTTGHVAHIGTLVQPAMNRHGFRAEQVYVGDRKPPAPASVPFFMGQWEVRLADPEAMIHWAVDLANGLDSDYPPDPDVDKALLGTFEMAAYYAFEWIHPFADGNGRTGKIIFNWLRGTDADPAYGLEHPEFPGNLWGVGNP